MLAATLLLSVLIGNNQVNSPVEVSGYVRGIRTPILTYVIGGKDLHGNALRLQCNAASQWEKLVASAEEDGIEIQVNFGFRTNKQQKKMFARNPHKAGKPGFSKHQQGLSVDIEPTKSAVQWMKKNAGKFGFKNSIKKEKWHWTYIGPVFGCEEVYLDSKVVEGEFAVG